MNWLDWLLLAMLLVGAVRGFLRGFIIELAGLIGLVLGVWAALHMSDRVAGWIGLGPDKQMLAFVITVLLVLVLVHLLAQALTKALDLVELSLPNKLAGVAFGVLRKAFVLSVLLNILAARSGTGWPPDKATCEASQLYEPITAIAPTILPKLKETKWVKRAIEEVRKETERITQ